MSVKRSIGWRDLMFVLALALSGALGALPGSRSGPDPVALLAWLAVWSAPAGFVFGASRLSLWPWAAVPPAAWMGLVAVVDGLSSRDLPSPAWSALAWSGLFAAGFGAGRISLHRGLSGAGALLLASATLCALPVAAGHLGAPLPPAVSARLLDLSPATLVEECAGLDWMRHPAIYDPAGSADIDPSLRVAFRGPLAGPLVFVVGCALALAGEGIARARSKASTNARWPSTNTSAPSPKT
jgi:hypothetical protein